MRSDRFALVQWLALGTMLVDHLGAVGILGEWSRILGRFALPAFVVMVAYNALHAPEPLTLVRRLLWLLLVSQPLWWLALGRWETLCILVTLLVVVALVWAWRSSRYDLLALVLLASLLVLPRVEYGILPLLLLPLVVWPSLPTLALALLWPWAQYDLALYQLPALVVVLALVGLVRFPFNVPRPPRWLSRSFYPAHLGALVFFSLVVRWF